MTFLRGERQERLLMLTSHAVFLAAPVDHALSSPEREVNAACFTAAFGSMLSS